MEKEKLENDENLIWWNRGHKGGTTFFKDIWAMQVFGIENLFREIKKEADPIKIVEIGTARGGLTNIFAHIFNNQTIHSFDIEDYGKFYYDNIEFYITDCHKEEFIRQYSDILFDSNGVCLYAIDGGDKSFEINLISSHTKSGDILMVHDYSINEEYFNSNKPVHGPGAEWNSFEIQESDINLTNVRRSKQFFDIGLKYAWGIYERV
jgi:hypothetical protein